MRTLGVIRELDDREPRVALVPEVVASIVKDKLASVIVETNAGLKAGFSDEDYRAALATIANTKEDLILSSETIVAINGAALSEQEGLANKKIIGLFDPFFNKPKIKKLCEAGNSVLALELVPRISRAQSMDVLSSQANIAGYVAVLMMANRLNKIMPLMMTAAGTIKPAKVLILGAGVAGLSAIATAKRLGAVVFAYDVRSAVKEQVESLGGKFVEIKLDESGEGAGGYAKALSEKSLEEQRGKLGLVAKDMDAVITTAQIPGKKAPLLLDGRVFSLMKRDSVIIDLASASGGNVPDSVPHEWVRRENVWLYGADNLARHFPKDASFTFGKNIRALLDLVFKSDDLDLTDEIISGALICHKKSFANETFR